MSNPLSAPRHKMIPIRDREVGSARGRDHRRRCRSTGPIDLGDKPATRCAYFELPPCSLLGRLAAYCLSIGC